jgi:hypothetical protein
VPIGAVVVPVGVVEVEVGVVVVGVVVVPVFVGFGSGTVTVDTVPVVGWIAYGGAGQVFLQTCSPVVSFA